MFDQGNTTLINAQIQDIDSTKVKIYKKQNINCEPQIIQTYTYTNKTFIENKGTATINAHTTFNEPFDIAKISISLDKGQEIHFITKNI